MAIFNKTNQIAIDASFSATNSAITAGDSATVAFGKAQGQINALVSGKSFRGGYDASVNLFPSTGGSGTAGAIIAGDFWTVTVAGTLGTQDVQVGNEILALIDTPGQTAANWLIAFDNVQSVNGQTGAVSLDIVDMNDYDGTTLTDADFIIYDLSAPGWKNYAISGDITINNAGVASLAFSSRTTNGNIDYALLGGGVQYIASTQTFAIGSAVIGRPYFIYNNDTISHTVTVTGTGAVAIGGDAQLVGLVQTINAGGGFNFTLQADSLTTLIN